MRIVTACMSIGEMIAAIWDYLSDRKFNGFDYFENKGITSILKKYQKQDQHKFFMMNDDEKKLWKDNCKNPIKIGFFKSVIIVYIPFVFAIFIRLKLA